MGAHDRYPENSIPAFEEAVRLGADGVELDVRLTKDGVLVVTHWLELEKSVGIPGYIFEMTFDEIRARPLRGLPPGLDESYIPRFEDVLARFAGKVGLEIEVKGPEPEAAEKVARALQPYRAQWSEFEVTSYEPALLTMVAERCPGLAVDILFNRSEPWMTAAIVAYLAQGTARLAGARAVHLHPTQLTGDGIGAIRSAGIEVHCWEVNSLAALELMDEFDIRRFTTDRVEDALEFRAGRVDWLNPSEGGP